MAGREMPVVVAAAHLTQEQRALCRLASNPLNTTPTITQMDLSSQVRQKKICQNCVSIVEIANSVIKFKFTSRKFCILGEVGRCPLDGYYQSGVTRCFYSETLSETWQKCFEALKTYCGRMETLAQKLGFLDFGS
mgnify:FL=1